MDSSGLRIFKNCVADRQRTDAAANSAGCVILEDTVPNADHAIGVLLKAEVGRSVAVENTEGDFRPAVVIDADISVGVINKRAVMNIRVRIMRNINAVVAIIFYPAVSDGHICVVEMDTTSAVTAFDVKPSRIASCTSLALITL